MKRYQVRRPRISWHKSPKGITSIVYGEGWAIYAYQHILGIGWCLGELKGRFATQHEAMTEAAKMARADFSDQIRQNSLLRVFWDGFTEEAE